MMYFAEPWILLHFLTRGKSAIRNLHLGTMTILICARLKKASRRLEHKWRSTKLQVFFHAWKDSLLSYKHALSTARSSYFSTLIDENGNNPRHLFNTVARLTKNHVDPCVSIPFSSNDFMNLFDDKIIKIRDTIQSSSTTPHVGSTLQSTQMDAESSEIQVAHLNSFASIDGKCFNKW